MVGVRQESFCEWTYEGGRKGFTLVVADGCAPVTNASRVLSTDKAGGFPSNWVAPQELFLQSCPMDYTWNRAFLFAAEVIYMFILKERWQP